MRIPHTTSSVKDSNLFLRALWSVMRAKFGKLAWQISPSKDGQNHIIGFGFADIAKSHSISVGIQYKQKGHIAAVLFDDIWGNVVAGLQSELNDCVAEAKALVSKGPVEHIFKVKIENSISIPFKDVVEPRFFIFTVDGNTLEFCAKTYGFDDVDARSEFMRIVPPVLDVMSFFTNATYTTHISHKERTLGQKVGSVVDYIQQIRSMRDVWAGARMMWRRVAVPPKQSSKADKYRPTAEAASSLDPDWIDGHPIVDGFLELEETCVLLIRNIVEDALSEDEQRMIEAAHHFHSGLAVENIGSMQGMRLASEQAITFYVSALEVASSDGGQGGNCKTCGQVQYKISERVEQFVKHWLGENVSKMVKKLYAKRSKYLHAGAILSTRSFSGKSIPQLDPSSETGTAHSIPLEPVFNLREFTSYCLRAKSRAIRTVIVQLLNMQICYSHRNRSSC